MSIVSKNVSNNVPPSADGSNFSKPMTLQL